VTFRPPGPSHTARLTQASCLALGHGPSSPAVVEPSSTEAFRRRHWPGFRPASRCPARSAFESSHRASNNPSMVPWSPTTATFPPMEPPWDRRG
jgi:hypothetical protein